MTTHFIAPSAGVVLCFRRVIAIAATTVMLFIAAILLPAGSSSRGGVLSKATSTVAPSEAHAFIRFSPSAINRWLQFRSRRPLVQCSLENPCNEIA